MNVDLVLRNARLVTCAVGAGNGALGTIDRGAVAIVEDRIAWVGPDDERPRRAGREIDLGGRMLMPGLVDPHTHLVFAGSRIDEFSRKMAGEDYRTIAASGGGIASTVRATRVASDETLFAAARARALAMRAFGTTTIEIKSGYGLTVDHELRLLEIGRRLHAEGVAHTTTTLLGAHAVPPERRDDRAGYVAEVAGVMIPRAADLGLADACDVYLDEGAFTLAEARLILWAAKEANLRPKAHVGQFADLGGAELVAELGGLSCDHLEVVSDRGLAAMAEANVTAVLLPGAWRTLRQTPPDAGRLRARGARIAIGTDCNPGTSPMMDLPACAALAVRDAGVTVDEAVLGITRHAAIALGQSDVGSIHVGARADLASYDEEDPRVLAYALAGIRARFVLLGGEIVLGEGDVPSILEATLW